ncbi:chloride channel protein [Cupriavidus basilensis]
MAWRPRSIRRWPAWCSLIEELGRGTAVRWDRLVLSGVLTAGFLSLALPGNNPYFVVRVPMLVLHDAWGPVLLCAVVNGVLGGLFAKALIGGVAGTIAGALAPLAGGASGAGWLLGAAWWWPRWVGRQAARRSARAMSRRPR